MCLQHPEFLPAQLPSWHTAAFAPPLLVSEGGAQNARHCDQRALPAWASLPNQLHISLTSCPHLLPLAPAPLCHHPMATKPRAGTRPSESTRCGEGHARLSSDATRHL